MRFKLPILSLYIFYLLIFVLFAFAYLEYPGQGYIYVIFTIVSNTLLYFGFRKNAIFFDTFIGVLLWLGFWFKLTIRVAFMDGQFFESIGNFDGSGAAFDHALFVTSCGLFGFLVASIIREKYVFTYPEKLDELGQAGLLKFYQDNRKVILSGFVILFITVAVTNAYFGIYQRGSIPKTILPYGLGGIYKWLLLFGCASITALILKYEFTLNEKTSYLVVILGLMESFFSNVSLLSRGMVINVSALVYGVIRSLKLNNIKSSFRFLVSSFLIFMILFGSSVILVNYLRSNAFQKFTEAHGIHGFVSGTQEIYQNFNKDLKNNKQIIMHVILDRWVGIEGVLAVSSYPDKGWDLWNEAWKETFIYNKLSFYDEHLITSQYRNTDLTKHHHISLPGIIAFYFYPGSFLFLFGCMFTLGAIASVIELSVFKLGGKNLILCSLLAMVVAYRYAHFGYVPGQSYLLFGALYLNLFIIYFSNKILLYCYNPVNVFEQIDDKSH